MSSRGIAFLVDRCALKGYPELIVMELLLSAS